MIYLAALCFLSNFLSNKIDGFGGGRGKGRGVEICDYIDLFLFKTSNGSQGSYLGCSARKQFKD